ncbi:hypothetical protein TKK_0014624 [Trichogramma kaykai]
MHLGHQRQHREHRVARNEGNYDPTEPNEQEELELMRREEQHNDIEAARTTRREAPPIPSRALYPQLKRDEE